MSCEEKFRGHCPNGENKLCYTNWRVLQNPTDPTGLPHLATNMDNFEKFLSSLINDLCPTDVRDPNVSADFLARRTNILHITLC